VHTLSYDAFRFLGPGLIGNPVIEVNLHKPKILGADGRGSKCRQDREQFLNAC
jgi:hypothetical protein